MTTYRTMLEDGQIFHFSGDFSHAGAPLHVNFHDADEESDWQLTPYQTADAGSPERAALLLARHYATGEDDCTSVASVEAV